MTTFVSMLRGINVSGQKIVRMEELRAAYGSIGFKDARSYVQSGNVVFEYPGANRRAVAKKIEEKVKRAFGFDVLVVIRTGEELGNVVRNCPLKGRDEGKLHVTFLTDYPLIFPTQDAEKVKGPGEEFVSRGREIYLFCPNGYGSTKLSNNFFERKLKIPATTRNWRTVNELLGMAGG